MFRKKQTKNSSLRLNSAFDNSEALWWLASIIPKISAPRSGFIPTSWKDPAPTTNAKKIPNRTNISPWPTQSNNS
ncbi:Uncharacterised protein [Vibrio cholerae]|nr:Uncharacterised protein [Vibrio cholerae]